MNYIGEYTGPYWSDGKIQPSVEWGESTPQSQLDWLSRQHDSAYAHFKDSRHREAADLIYMREAKKLAGQFPELAGNLVGYGNYAGRQVKNILSDVGLATKLTGNPLFGVVKYGVDSLANNVKRLNGTYLKNELEDVNKFYGTDPYKMRKPADKVEGSLEKILNSRNSVRGASGVALVENDGQRRVVSNGGRPPRPQEPRVSTVQATPVIATPLNASASTEQVQAQHPIAVTKTSLFQRLKRKKKKKNRVESLEDRVKRLTLAQASHFDNYNNTHKTALNSKLKNKHPAFGFNRVDKIRVKARRELEKC